MQYGKSVVEYTVHTTRAVFGLYERSNKRGLNIIDWRKWRNGEMETWRHGDMET